MPMNILVTRPLPQGKILCDKIIARGDNAIYFPTIAFNIFPEEYVQTAIKNLNEKDILIFNSPQSVTASIFAIKKIWPQLPLHVQCAAVGLSTAMALQRKGYPAIYPDKNWGAEGLLALDVFQNVAGKKILIIRGKEGREILEKILKERGARVETLITYERILPTINSELNLSLFEQKKINVMMATSCESVRNLHCLLPETIWQTIHSIPLLVASERIKQLAQRLGFQTIWVAQNASDEAMLAVIEEKRNQL